MLWCARGCRSLPVSYLFRREAFRLVRRAVMAVFNQNKVPKRRVLAADPVYPPSLYRAVSYASTLGVPVYILENGMPSKAVRPFCAPKP